MLRMSYSYILVAMSLQDICPIGEGVEGREIDSGDHIGRGGYWVLGRFWQDVRATLLYSIFKSISIVASRNHHVTRCGW